MLLLSCILAVGAITFTFICFGNLIRGNEVKFLHILAMAVFIVATIASFRFV